MRQAVPVYVGGALLLVFGSGCFHPTTDAAPGKDASADSSAKCVTSDDAERMSTQVLHLVNLERGVEGLPPLVLDPVLEGVAEDFACRMIDEGFFAHRDPGTGEGVSERAAAAEYPYLSIGENLAAGQVSAAEVMRVWMESPSHRANILDPSWEEIGIAVRFGGEYSVYWVQEFGQPADE